jgi:hypothetical protein
MRRYNSTSSASESLAQRHQLACGREAARPWPSLGQPTDTATYHCGPTMSLRSCTPQRVLQMHPSTQAKAKSVVVQGIMHAHHAVAQGSISKCHVQNYLVWSSVERALQKLSDAAACPASACLFEFQAPWCEATLRYFHRAQNRGRSLLIEVA